MRDIALRVQTQACGGISLRPSGSRLGNRTREVTMPVWAWVLIIVLLVLLLTGGVYVRR